MDSRVVQNEVHENDEHYPHIVPSEQDIVTHGEEEHHFDHEKKSVMNKVKAKAKKIKDTIKKHGNQVLDRGREYSNEDQHDLDDHDLDEDEDTQVHETPIHESEDVKTATPTGEQVETLGKSGNDFGGTTVMADESHHNSLTSSTTEIDQNIATEPAKTFPVEEKAGLTEDNMERSIGLEEEHYTPGSRPEAYTHPNYQTEVTDSTAVVKDEMKITPVEESFARMNVQDEPKSTPELNVQPSIVDSEYPHVGNHDQFVPQLSAAMQTPYPSECHEQFTQETISPSIIRNLENVTDSGQTFNTITTTVEEHSCNEANTDKVASLEDFIASEVGSGEKDDIKDKVVTNEEQQKSGDASNMSGSTAQYGKYIAHSLTEKLAPVYEKVGEVGSALKSKVSGTSTGGVGTETNNEVKEQDKGVSVKDYLAEKLRPGEEDKALSEVISEALYKRKEEPVKNEHHLDGGDEKMCEESCVHDVPGKGVVDKLKDVVGSWFGKSEGKGGEHLSKNTNFGAELEQVNQVVGENKSSPIEEQGTR